MPNPDKACGDEDFIVLAPAGRDAQVVCELLTSGRLSHRLDASGELLLQAIVDGAGAGGIVTDDGLARISLERLRDAIERQPPWSDFPFVLLSRRGETRLGPRLIEELVNVTVLERPLHPATLLSAARSARRGRGRQRLAARHLDELEKARAELRGLADTLEDKVRERTFELAAANDRLVREIAERERAEARLIQAQKMEAVGQLTGGIAHDFNNLLTAIIGSLDLLLRRSDDEAARKLARNALQAAQRGADLTSQLLSFSRRQRLTPTPVQPNDVVSGMADMIARTIGPHVIVEMSLEPDLWLALADRTQLEMMILNLAINARDAMPSGGRVKIVTRNVREIPPALADELEPGAYVSLAVTDSGVGMPPEILSRVFEPFFTTKGPGQGTGLGLAQLYGFAKQSGGTARIESRIGEGTTVTIYLPRTREDVVAAAPERSQPVALGKTRILVVDDDDDVRQVAAAMVEQAGYEVEAARSGAEALRVLESGRCGLVLSDVVMPGMSGVELARIVRERFPGVKIAFASGYADLQRFGDDLSGQHVLKKPYGVTDVAALIHAALQEEDEGEEEERGNVVAFPSVS